MSSESMWVVLDPPKFMDMEPLTATSLATHLLAPKIKRNYNRFRKIDETEDHHVK
jgi:hypothetical protein